MFERLEITGLRGFADTGVLNLAQPNGVPGSGLTMLVGPNSGGKSTIIEALRALSSPDIEGPSFTEGKRNKMAGDVVNLHLVAGENSRRLNTVATGGSQTTWIARNPANPRAGGNILSLPSRRFFIPYFGRTSHQREQYSHQIGTLNTRGEPINFQGRLFRILENRASFNAVLEKVLSPLPNWTIEQSDQGQYYLKFQTGNLHHNSDGLGEGIVSLFFIIDALYDSLAGDLIAIDEPELSLHPMFQRKLAKLFAEYSQDRQIVYATHSPYFTNFEYVSNGAHVARVAQVGTSSRIFELRRQTAQSISRLLTDRNNPHILGLDAREAFFLNDGIILVEGQEDVVLYPKVLEQIDFEIDGEFFGWGVGGADKMDIIASLFRDLGFSKLVGLLDGNRGDLIEPLQRSFPNYQFIQIPADDVRTKDAVRARPQVIGLLDEEGNIREEQKTSLRALFNEINRYLNLTR